MYGLWQMLKMTKPNEWYVNVGEGFTGRGGLVPLGWLETKYVSDRRKNLETSDLS